jgi:hypothetical protein
MIAPHLAAIWAAKVWLTWSVLAWAIRIVVLLSGGDQASVNAKHERVTDGGAASRAMAAGAAVQFGLVALVRTDRPGPGPSSRTAVAIEAY